MSKTNSLTKRQLASNVARRTGQPRTAVEVTVQTVFDELSAALAAGRSVYLKDFGRFNVYHLDERCYRHPGTGRAIRLGRCQYLRFVASRTLKRMAKDRGDAPSLRR